MKLFNPAQPAQNILPYDGTVNYYGVIFTKTDQIFTNLLAHVSWKNDEAIIFGKHIHTKRKVAWYGDKAYEYSYSGILKIANL
ncbi:MAG: alpha-ketoglutarate-dependent dioxygenase AlkB, partial [Sphingobacterium sp.]